MMKIWKLRPPITTSILVGTLIGLALLKTYYALSRPLFYSGPDANGYIPAMQDFGSKPFLSTEISFQPGYPPGYPYLGSIFYRFSSLYWIQFVQIFQIVLFSGTLFLSYLLVKKKIDSNTALMTSMAISLSPAIAVLNGEAMYESLFMALLFATLFTLVYPENYLGILRSFTGGLLLGGVVVVHPRALLIVCIILIYLIFLKRVSVFAFFAGVFGFLIPFLIFSFRNLIAENTFTLSSALWASLTANRFMSGCQSISCVANRAFQEPLGFMEQVTLNVLHFWSPYSGPLKRGTWFHNVSLLTYLDNHGMQTFATLISILLMILLFFTWLHGTLLLNSVSKGFNLLYFGIFAASLINDALIYGDSRHRLAVMAFALPAQITSIRHIVRNLARVLLPVLSRFLQKK